MISILFSWRVCDVPRRDVVSCKLVLDVVAGCELVYLLTVMLSLAFWSILVVDRRRKISKLSGWLHVCVWLYWLVIVSCVFWKTFLEVWGVHNGRPCGRSFSSERTLCRHVCLG